MSGSLEWYRRLDQSTGDTVFAVVAASQGAYNAPMGGDADF